MAGNAYLTLDPTTGRRTQVRALQASAGAGSAGSIIALNAAGQLDNTMLPTGIGPDTLSVLASETIASGALVNVYSNAGTLNVRNADASAASAAKEANGFVLVGGSSGTTLTVYFNGNVSGLTGLTVGAPVYLGTVGAAVATPALTAGYLVQRVGIATSATAFNFTYNEGDITA
jgi:hypothetical protein